MAAPPPPTTAWQDSTDLRHRLALLATDIRLISREVETHTNFEGKCTVYAYQERAGRDKFFFSSSASASSHNFNAKNALSDQWYLDASEGDNIVLEMEVQTDANTKRVIPVATAKVDFAELARKKGKRWAHDGALTGKSPQLITVTLECVGGEEDTRRDGKECLLTLRLQKHHTIKGRYNLFSAPSFDGYSRDILLERTMGNICPRLADYEYEGRTSVTSLNILYNTLHDCCRALEKTQKRKERMDKALDEVDEELAEIRSKKPCLLKFH
jgi:hypothetical protein